MENNFKGTKWKVYASEIRVEKCYIGIISEKGLIIRCFYDNNGDIISEQEAEANAQLITDAFEVRQQINFDLPELLNRYNKAVELLDRVRLGEFPEKEIKQFLKTLEK